MVECTAQLDSVFCSLADPTRRDILRRVAQAELSIGEIAQSYNLTFAAISKHLKILENAQLISKRRQGKRQFVQLTPATLKDAAIYLQDYEKVWNDRFNALEELLRKGVKQQMTTEHNQQELIITRIFDVPREKVWEAWTKPELFVQWYGKPGNVPAETVAFDVRPGGEWCATTVAPDGTEHPFVGTYREVVKPERLVFAFENPADRNDPHVEIVTVTCTEKDGQTEMTFKQAGYLPPQEYATGLKQGWNGFFDHLATVLG